MTSQGTAEGASAIEDQSAIRPGLRIGRVVGVEVRVDASLSIIFVLIAAHLGLAVIPRWHPEWGFALTWGVSVAAAVLFFVSVLVHELSHALVARQQGMEVKWVTLFLFGGLAHMGEPPSPKVEFLVSIVGPITSLAIGVVATLGGVWLGGSVITEAAMEAPAEMLSRLGPGATLLLWLGPVNIILAVFNVLPGFPLDGGRVLRSVLWWATSDVVKATRWASLVGQAFAWALMAWGLVHLFHGALLQGVWLMLIGWFLNNAARVSFAQLRLRHALADVPARRVMNTHVQRVAPELPIDELVREYVIASEDRTFVVERDGRLVGLVTVDDLRQVPQARWPTTPISEVMTQADQLSTLPPTVSAKRVMDEMGRRNVEQIPIVQEGRVVGLGRRRDLVEWAALQHQAQG
jgi:Zn-dependent protease/CBS domain-containing protein